MLYLNMDNKELLEITGQLEKIIALL